MKEKILLIFIISIIFILSCERKPEKIEEENQQEAMIVKQVSEFTIPAGHNIFTYLGERGFHNTELIQKIIGSRIAKKGEEQETACRIITEGDSLEITELDLQLFNGDFKVSKSARDSIRYIVEVEKPILRGGSIYQVLYDLGMSNQQVGYYTWMMGEYIDATTIDVGDIVSVTYHLDSLHVKHFQKFSYKPDKTSVHEFYILGEKELENKLVELPYELKRSFITGTISDDFPTWDDAMNDCGIIPYIRQQANNAMESQIAFSTDARSGDEFEIYMEEKYVKGVRQPRGKLLYCSYSGKYTGSRQAYRFSDDDPASAYTGMYTVGGKRLVTDAVRTPLDRMHVTSPFGYRIHPIYGRRKMHNGMDLRGWTGTSVYAVSSGTVIKAANNGNGYGKEIRIRHENGMITQYAHLSSIKVNRNQRVRKGQLIGKVGNTGVSTGPHLHFGVMKNGRWVNPKTNLKMVGANQLKDSMLNRFKQQIKEMNEEMGKTS